MIVGKPLIDPSLTNEEKIKKLSKVVERLGRRSRKVAKALITPCLISNCISGDSIDGDILKYMFSCPGAIGKCGIFLDKKLDVGVSVILDIKNELGGSQRSYHISRRNLLFEPQIDVSTWDRLTISIYPVDPEEKISEVWISLLWTPTIKDVKIKNYLIDQLDGDLDVED